MATRPGSILVVLSAVALSAAAALCGCKARGELLGTIASPIGDAAPGGDSGSPWPAYLIGADISNVQQQQESGIVFSDTDGTPTDILQILKNHGFNFARLRTFVDPRASDGYATMMNVAQPYCDLANTIAMAKRIKAAGLGWELDFHYSDNWADASMQVIPLAWQGESLPDMVKTLGDYTRDAIAQLVSAGVRPDIVQIGNEITPGILLTPGTVTGSVDNWTNLALFLQAGIDAVHAVDPTIKIMVHLDRGGDNAGTTGWINAAIAHGVHFDILGEACYTNVQGDPSTWLSNFNSLVTQYPDLGLMIVEYSESADDLSGNVDIWRQANDIVFNLAGKRGLGALVWEPTEWQETLFDAQGRTNAADLPNPFIQGSPRINLYDQMASDYGLR
jgi:arabinogalactan endo-1,4-beta-galactosidase